MGVMMGKIVEVNGKEVQLVLQGLDEEDLIKQVDAINEMERKSNAFDTFLKYKKHVEKYDNSDCHELEQVFKFAMKEYEEDQ